MKNITKILFLLAVVFVLGMGCKSKPSTITEAETDGGGIRDIFAGAANVFILMEDNTLWGAGYNQADQFGSGVNTQGMSGQVESSDGKTFRVTQIKDDTGAPFSDVKTVAAGENHTVILKKDGTLWGAGNSSNGELGQTGENYILFTGLKAGGVLLSGIKEATAGNNSTFFIDGNGSLWASGYNYYGELGLGNRDAQSSFSTVGSAGQNIKAIAAGIRHSVILKDSGSILVTGYNYNGQLGLGNKEDKESFTEVRDAGSDITAVAAGNYHTVILKSDGTVWTTGSNYWGQLGFADNSDRQKFTRVNDEKGSPLSGVTEIAARGDITVLLKSDGSILLAGNYVAPQGGNEPDYNAIVDDNGQGSYGVLLDDAKSSFVQLVPEQASVKFGEVKKIVLGYNSIYVITSDGRLWAAGSNRYGQLNLDPETGTSSELKLIEFN